MSLHIEEHVPLAPRTTLGVGGDARYFATIHNNDELMEALLWAKEKQTSVSVLGGGSNVLIDPSGVEGLVLHLASTGVLYEAYEDGVQVTAEAGVILDHLIAELVQKRLWGLENLSAIPGTVGAVPIQNVGAYGVEAKDVVRAVTVYDKEYERVVTLTNTECGFGYRDSIFKQRSTRYIILSVTFFVSKNENRVLKYRDLQNYFGIHTQPSLSDIRNAIIEIRSKKFPDWKKIGTAGSFFKNPSIDKETFFLLQETYPELPGHENSDGSIKISLGWVLDHVCGFRGYTEGNVGLYTEQALVLVCNKNATSEEIKNFSEKIIQRVHEKTGIHIEREVTILS